MSCDPVSLNLQLGRSKYQMNNRKNSHLRVLKLTCVLVCSRCSIYAFSTVDKRNESGKHVGYHRHNWISRRTFDNSMDKFLPNTCSVWKALKYSCLLNTANIGWSILDISHRSDALLFPHSHYDETNVICK